jgi:hypothetical protein
MFMSQLVWSNILFLSINKTNQVWKNTPQKMLSKIYIKKKVRRIIKKCLKCRSRRQPWKEQLYRRKITFFLCLRLS